MTGKKKFPLPTWLGCLLLVALTLLGSLRYWLPITEDSGESYTLRLERAFVSNNTLWLDFGKSDHFRFPYAEADSPLLKASAVGKEYHITAEYHATRRNRSDYYEIYALTGADGTEYLTISQAEAQRLGMLPLRITLLVTLNAVVCIVVIWADKRRRKTLTAADNAPDDPEEEEESP